MRGSSVCLDMSSTCVQGGLPRPLGGYQANVIMEPHSPAPAWNMHQSVVPKPEPMATDRNDSGINSGSDFQSSSPGSENSQDYSPPLATPTSSTAASTSDAYYATPVTSQCERQSMTYHMGFNPLTPPSTEPMVSPKCETKQEEQDTDLTPHTSPGPNDLQTPSSSDNVKASEEDALKRLQMTFEKNSFLPTATLSPRTTSEHSGDDDNKESWEESEENVRNPTVNSHGKVKTFKCKQCDFVAITKLDFWDHSKMHIKTDKILTCPKCPFVTEYKHHLEYHLRNHFGSKPFKCDKCPYSCVNRSMLNSHMKSHSNVYQYRCKDCTYATKYCHSLKLHLRKYRHEPAMVLNSDGSPNPLPIIDVYGTRRGPKQKGQAQRPQQPQQQQQQPQHLQQQQQQHQQQPSPMPADIPLPIQQLAAMHHQPSMPSTSTAAALQTHQIAAFMNLAAQNHLPFPYAFFPGALSNPLLLAQQLAHQMDRLPEQSEQLRTMPQPEEQPEEAEPMETSNALDLTATAATETEVSPRNRRKGTTPAKVERPTVRPRVSEDETSDDEVKQDEDTSSATSTKKVVCRCKFCAISFEDVIMYAMHMGYHGYQDPYACNMCGEQCNDRVGLFLHIARTQHV